MTYESESTTAPSRPEAAGEAGAGAPRGSPPSPGRPTPGGALHHARRIVLGGRIVLLVAAVFCATRAAATSDLNVDASDRWTVAMMAAVCLILAGGMVWWVEPTVPAAGRSRERARTIGRQLRGGIATAGVAGFFVAVSVGEETVGLVALLIAPFSLLALPLAMIGRRSTHEIRLATASPAQVGADPDHADAVAAIAAHRITLADRAAPPRGHEEAAPPRTSHPLPEYQLPEGGTVRPRAPAGEPVPRHLRAWVDNGALSCDGRSITVTDRKGGTHTRRLADGPDGHDPNGVAGIIARREVVRIATARGWSMPQYRQNLSLLDTAGRRLLDLEIHGWTRSELTGFARAAGLTLETYQPEDTVYLPYAMGTPAPTPFERAFPRALGYAKAPGGTRTGEVALTIGVVLGVLALFACGVWLYQLVGQAVPAPPPWPGIAAMASVFAVLLPGMLALYLGFDRVNRRRHAAAPGPPDAI